MMQDLPVLVIGGSGFIGRNLVEALLKTGRQVRILDLSPSRIDHDNLSHWSGSFLQAEFLHEAMTGVSHVFHLAATMMPREANQDPRRDCAENVVGTLGVLEAALSCGVSRLVFSSSGGTVYGQTKTLPIAERHPTFPINAYGISKLACEKYVRLYNGRGRDVPLSTLSLRIANPYGPHQNIKKAQGALTTFCVRASAGEKIVIWGDGSVVRDFVHIGDVARALMLAADADVSGTEINIGAGRGVSLNEILDLIEDILGQPVEREYTAGRTFDVERNYLDTTKARDHLGWMPKFALRDGVAELLAHLQELRSRA